MSAALSQESVTHPDTAKVTNAAPTTAGNVRMRFPSRPGESTAQPAAGTEASPDRYHILPGLRPKTCQPGAQAQPNQWRRSRVQPTSVTDRPASVDGMSICRPWVNPHLASARSDAVLR